MDLDEQYPRVDHRDREREDHSGYDSTETPNAPVHYGQPHGHERERGCLTKHHPRREVAAQGGLWRPPVPQLEHLDGNDGHSADDAYRQHLHPVHHRPLDRHQQKAGHYEYGHL